MSDSPDGWLDARMEGVPGAFRPWLEDDDAGEPSPDARAEDLEERGLRALRKALSGPGRHRPSAFHLLAADAWLTWAAEASLDGADAEAALRGRILRTAAEAAAETS